MDSKGDHSHKKPLKYMACMPKKDLNAYRQRLLDSIELPSKNDLRRQRLPFHICIMEELQEEGFREAALYIRDLIEENDNLRKHDEVGIIPRLVDFPLQLEWLKAGARNAEIAKRQNDKKKESSALLQMACLFSEEGRGWLWLAEQLHLAGIAVAETVFGDGGQKQAACKFAYARFLFNKYPESDIDEVKSVLAYVRDKSNGKNWDATEEVGEPQGTLFVETCLLLHAILLRKAKEMRDEDPYKAERMCALAVKRALDAERADKEAEALTEMGSCQLASKDLNRALKNYTKALQIQVQINNFPGICEGHMHMAAALQMLHDTKEAESHLTEMGTMALEKDLTYHLGLALELLGELYLREGQPKTATPHLKEAFRCFRGQLFGVKRASQTSVEIQDIRKDPEQIQTEVIKKLVEYRKSRAVNREERRSRSSTTRGPSAAKRSETRRRSQSSKRSRSDSRSSRRLSFEANGIQELGRSARDEPARRKALPRDSSKNVPAKATLAEPAPEPVVFTAEADQARCMSAVSTGQELMPIFFEYLIRAETCIVARLKIINWKLRRVPFWVKNEVDDEKCPCPYHMSQNAQLVSSRPELLKSYTKYRLDNFEEKDIDEDKPIIMQSNPNVDE